MLNVIGKILYGFFILLLIGVAGLFLTSLLPISGNIQVKIVKSGSMEPAISTGSIVVVQPSATYQVNDIITFGKDTRDQIPTTHRVIGKQVENGITTYQTKGDANEEADPVSVPHSTTIGKVVFAVPYAGYILDFARQPLGFTFMIGIPAGIIILDEIIRIWTEVTGMRRGRREKEKEAATLRNNVHSAQKPEQPRYRTSVLNVPPRTPIQTLVPGVRPVFDIPGHLGANEPLDLRKRLMSDENTLNLRPYDPQESS